MRIVPNAPDHSPLSYWKVPAYLDSVQPALTRAAVTAAETQLGVKLRQAYLALLWQQNGGYLRATWPDRVSRALNGIGPRFPSITLDDAWWRPGNAGPEEWVPRDPELLIPFDGDGHWDMCFDYRACRPNGEPTVTCVDCELEEETAIADSFSRFLAGLVDETAQESTRLYGSVDPQDVAHRMAEHLRLSEPSMDAWAYGYPVWHIALRGKSQSCWVSRNRAPAGFRREGERVLVTKETALRLPEDPDCVVLLACTDESKAVVLAALTALGLSTR